ncbi:MAG: hypothetical protein JRC99_10120 [Deltaproteobacteria bacterium]|nr:hypothetical protein [Deltaproteobacteria bacterium]
MLRWIFLLCFLFLHTACDVSDNKERPDAPVLNPNGQFRAGDEIAPAYDVVLTATTLLNEPTPVYRFETTAEALSVWRQAAERPTLLLLSNNPHLQTVPEELRKQVSILINKADAADLAMATTDRNSDPLLLPGMAVDAALRSNLFQELIWVLPLRDPSQELSLEKFTDQLAESGLANEQEKATLALAEGTFNGTLRDTAFTAAALPLLQDPTQPVIVHIDLSYFQPLYKNEIATPLLDIVFNTLATLKKMHLQTLAVTFSYGHLDSQISLDVRFLGDIIAYLIEDPARLDQPIPLNWQRQRDTLYLSNFFQKEKVWELYKAQEQDAPNEAWVKFNLYRSAAEHKKGRQALDYLAEAVSLDYLYALEYQELSKMAYEKDRPDEAFRILTLSSEAFPHDPFIKLQMIQLAQSVSKKEAALRLLKQLRSLQWSEFYYPQMPQYLVDLTTFVQTGEVSVEQSTDSATVENNKGPMVPLPVSDNARKRLLHNQ